MKKLINLRWNLSISCFFLKFVVIFMSVVCLLITKTSFSQKNITNNQAYVRVLLALSIVEEDSTLSGSKQYELTNHLGNVLATVSDRRIQTITPPTGTSGVLADLLSASDYYAFGMQMSGRNFYAESYRFGFNGMENDNRVKGSGNQQDYGFRIYDARLAKFLSVDPLTSKYPWYTPYQFAGNKPIAHIDIDGQEEGNKPAKNVPVLELINKDYDDVMYEWRRAGSPSTEEIKRQLVEPVEPPVVNLPELGPEPATPFAPLKSDPNYKEKKAEFEKVSKQGTEYQNLLDKYDKIGEKYWEDLAEKSHKNTHVQNAINKIEQGALAPLESMKNHMRPIYQGGDFKEYLKGLENAWKEPEKVEVPKPEDTPPPSVKDEPPMP
jgi:RHS repeat-associated protein